MLDFLSLLFIQQVLSVGESEKNIQSHPRVQRAEKLEEKHRQMNELFEQIKLFLVSIKLNYLHNNIF